jgi:hypothetical protein
VLPLAPVHRSCFALVTVVALFGGCSGDGFDRQAAIAATVEGSSGRISVEQAECYVDRVVDEVGTGALDPDASLPAELVGRLTAIRIDCVGVANLGADPPSTAPTEAPPDEPPPAEPLGPPPPAGPTTTLDQLRRECADGYGASCDALFDEAPFGSDDERFAATCGGRSREQRCVDVYPGPGVTLPSAAQTTTTEAPPGP